jgi:hypothetical protein
MDALQPGASAVWREYAQRLHSELGRVRRTGITRGELAILMLDVDDDAVTESLTALLRSGQVTTDARDDLVRYRQVVP